MRHVNRTVGVLFLAASSVYAAQASGRSQEVPANVPVSPLPPGLPAALQSAAAPFPSAGAEGTAASSQPSAPEAAPELIPVEQTRKEQPLREGQPVRAGQVNVSESGTVEIHVVDANMLEVLRMLASQSQKNIIASKEVRGAVTANLYDVTIREALDAILHSNGFAYREKGNFIYVYTAKELQEIEKATRKTQTEVFRVFYTPANNAVSMIKPVLSTDAQVSFSQPATSGLGTGTTDVGGNSHATEEVIVVTDYPENLDKIREVLKEVDRRPQQILVEATILSATLTEDNSLGVDFTLLGGVDFQSITGLGSNAGPGVLSGSTLNNAGANNILENGFGGAGTGFTNGLPQGGLRMGFVSNNIAVFLQALESVTDTTVLSNPKILALNRQKGEVIVGRKDGYLTTTVTSSSSTQTVEFLDTGTRLIFRPYIGDDGYIRMEIHPESSTGGLTSANLPFKQTTEVTSNVMVKDGRTIVIGGLFREATDSSKSQVPILGNIPLAGNLFRNQRDRTSREEIIILLTPHIIKDDEGYSKESLASQKDFEKLRVGVRKGMMPTGRERLAEISYEKAVEEMNKPTPNRAKALWHLDIATNLNPKFLEAVNLKEKLTGQELNAVDNSSMRGFLRKRVMAESSLPQGTPPSSYRVPEPRSEKPSETPAAPASEVVPAAGPGPQPATRPTVEVPPAEAAPAPALVVASPATKPAERAEAPSTRPAITVVELPEGEGK